MARSDWERRAILRQAEYDRMAEEVTRNLSRAYNKAARQIFSDVESIIGNFANFFGLTKEQAKELLKANTAPEVLARLQARVNAMPKGKERLRLQAILSAPAYAARISRLQAIETAARVTMAEVATIEVEADTEALRAVSVEAYNRTLFDVEQKSGYLFNTVGMSKARTEEILRQNWSGVYYSERVWHNTRATAKLAAQGVQEMLIAGKASRSTYEAIKAATTHGAFAANRLLRTEYNYVSGQAELASYEDAAVDKYRYIAVLDGRTSQVCRDLDGKVFPVKDRQVGVNMHPMHPWCRSSTEPVLSVDTRAQEKRWARDPVTGEEMKVPADMTYREWEKKQSELRLKNSEKRANIELAVTKDEKRQAEVLNRIRSDETAKNINPEKQARHIKESSGYKVGRSYIYGDESTAQELVNRYAGKGIPNFTPKGEWKNTELVILDRDIGVDVRKDGTEIVTNSFKIHYSKTGVHIVPTRRR